MSLIRWLLLVTLAVAAVAPAGAQTAAVDSVPAPSWTPARATGAPPASSSISNPAISVIGWFQAAAGNDSAAQENPFDLREAELALQAAVDPMSRADFFLSAGPEGLEIEEGYLTWLALPGGGQARVGKFRTAFGKFNLTHPPETPFADRPLAPAAFLGGEGLATTGVWASALVPNPMDLYWEVLANVGTVPDAEESPLFEAASRRDVLVVGRSSVFVPIGEAADVNLGLSYANARANPGLAAEGDRAQLGAGDLTLRWKNPRRSIYRSLLVQIELIGERGSAEGAEGRSGSLAYAVYQFARQWKAGLRWDWTEHPGAPGHASGALAVLQYRPSEFSTVSVQLRRIRDDAADRDFDGAFLKWIFNIGPHGAHPY